jgi:hypothetical protein
MLSLFMALGSAKIGNSRLNRKQKQHIAIANPTSRPEQPRSEETMRRILTPVLGTTTHAHGFVGMAVGSTYEKQAWIIRFVRNDTETEASVSASVRPRNGIRRKTT